LVYLFKYNVGNLIAEGIFCFGPEALLFYDTYHWVYTKDYFIFQNITFPTSFAEYYLNIQYVNGLYLGVGAYGQLFFSDDGLNWDYTDEGFDQIISLLSNGDKFILSTSNYLYNNENNIYDSTDGLNWNPITNFPISQMAYIDSLQTYIGLNKTSIVASSSPVGPWDNYDTQLPTLDGFAFDSLGKVLTYYNDPEWAYSKGIVSAANLGEDFNIIYNYTGEGCPPCRKEIILSQIAYSKANNGFSMINYPENQFLTLTKDIWNKEQPPCSYASGLKSANDILYINCYFGEYVMRRVNGGKWTNVTIVSESGINSLKYYPSLNIYIAIVDYGLNIAYSKDGINFVRSRQISEDTIEQIYFTNIVYNQGVFLAVGKYFEDIEIIIYRCENDLDCIVNG